METSNHDISEQNRNSILNHIIDCANCALKGENTFHEAMISLAHEFRTLFDSEYCAIGTVVGGIAEDSAIDFQISGDELKAKKQVYELKFVRSKPAYDDDTLVSKALKSPLDISLFDKNEFFESRNYDLYAIILDSGEPKNSIVIPIRDNKGENYGFIQFININDTIDYERYIQPYKEAFLGLVQIIINNRKNQQELIKKKKRLRDADFYNMMQEKRANVDELLDSIMNYFSVEFNAAVVSFRVPILNGYKKEPLFYLRRVFIHPSIGNSTRDELIHRYHTERLVKSKDDMNVVTEFRCDNRGKILENESESDFSQFGLNLDNNTLVIPILRDSDQKCILPQRLMSEYCRADEHRDCKYRFKRLYGIFRVRISRTHLTDNRVNYHFDLDETKERLGYLSKQITLLINSIVNRFKNESLTIFQDELRNSSFIKINDFDEQCVGIIRESVHAKVCSIYRYDERTKLLALSATTARIIHFKVSGRDVFFESERIKDSCFIHFKTPNNILARTWWQKRSEYVLDIFDTNLHDSLFIEFTKSDNNQETAMAIPMIKKDGTCAGVVLLLGKQNNSHSISTKFWEHDIDHIEFIVNMLTRMSESDTERLTFLSQLSHELLAPVTELVYDNDLILNIAERNFDSISKRQLVEKIHENVNRNMLFKYIISDTEFIYSSTGRSIDYNIVKQEKPQTILLDAIRLLEKQAHAKGLSIITFIKQMPPLYFDKERMMQVFLNLLKNAIRYADNFSEISISYHKREDGLHEIRFADFGISIQEEEKESIFELFHRGTEAIEKIPRGTGMGLYIARNIMRAHGGDCYVIQLNNPTEFVITLPNKKTNNF